MHLAQVAAVPLLEGWGGGEDGRWPHVARLDLLPPLVLSERRLQGRARVGVTWQKRS